jgi:Domain of unknown function (DUF4249)
MKNLIILLFASVLMFSCEQTIRLDLEQSPSKIVIEGLVTNQPGYQMVKVTRSAAFYDSGHTPRITNATVTVADDLGNIYTFVHNPNDVDDSLGIYVPQIPFEGAIGRIYKLTVEVDGELYEAEDELFPVTTIDSLNYRVDPDEKEDPEITGKYYEVRMYTREPQGVANYYLFKFYRNDSLIYDGETDIYYSDDQFLAENIDGVGTPIYFGINDKATVEMYSMSRQGYVFYDDLNDLLNTDGGMFGPIPASPRTNLSNGALGFFQVSAIDRSNIEIK